MSETNTQPFDREVAKAIIVPICTKLAPFCEVVDEQLRLHIAGSLRRGVQWVRDGEIVCQPKVYEQRDIFGQVTGYMRDPNFMATAIQLGEVLIGKPSGRYMKILLPQGIKLDLFMPQPHDFFRQLAVRTGSRTFSEVMLAGGWKRLGWVGTEDGLRRKDQCKEVSPKKWECVVKNPTLPPCWNSEKAFFEFLGLEEKYLLPRNRNM